MAQALSEGEVMGTVLFPVARFLIDLCPTSTLILPANSGSVFHGGLGAALKTVADPADYQYLFETLPPPNTQRMPKSLAIPRPYIIEPPLNDQPVYHAGELMQMGLVLIGKGIPFLPVFVAAFEEFGRRGFHRGRDVFRLRPCGSGGPMHLVEKKRQHREHSSCVFGRQRDLRFITGR
jgi:hypothetical protein